MAQYSYEIYQNVKAKKEALEAQHGPRLANAFLTMDDRAILAVGGNRDMLNDTLKYMEGVRAGTTAPQRFRSAAGDKEFEWFKGVAAQDDITAYKTMQEKAASDKTWFDKYGAGLIIGALTFGAGLAASGASGAAAAGAGAETATTATAAEGTSAAATQAGSSNIFTPAGTNMSLNPAAVPSGVSTTPALFTAPTGAETLLTGGGAALPAGSALNTPSAPARTAPAPSPAPAPESSLTPTEILQIGMAMSALGRGAQGPDATLAPSRPPALESNLPGSINEDSAEGKARARQRRVAASSIGRGDTILTSPLGILGTSRKQQARSLIGM